ncbi:hypothetical protein PN441_19545 [Spirulina major CS-329]|uniref:hypothetical protein n=1 Tax=Spirulina TaxID=1154 RepID=UPI00232F66E3|nr:MULTISPECIES: hypothetical protein [Spirulina]MDB9494650.1 hypothetical protein [Spirulina subsalsa CS-330]MDB9505279.1 hypothetical protein [Spirulina major CS-329]
MKKKNFSSFILQDAYQQLDIEQLTPWVVSEVTLQPSAFFRERLLRLQTRFDLRYCEKSKELLIDAFCEEAMEGINTLKIWKGAKLEGEKTTGNVDYLIAPRKDYLDLPFLCIVEAKKDDFEQGLAQCLVEMKVCQERNIAKNKRIDIYGIVTNGDGWRFYRLSVQGMVQETALYSTKDLDLLLGVLNHIFQACHANLFAPTS